MLLQSFILSNIFSQFLLPGSQIDNIHNCALDGGYTWCKSYRNCVRMWETPCPDNYDNCDDCLSKQRNGINIACPEDCDTIVIDPIPPVPPFPPVPPVPPISIDPIPCPDVMCMMYCSNGNKIDENGCNICECNYDETTVPDCELVQPSCDDYNYICPKVTEITSCNEDGIDGYTTFQVSLITKKNKNIKNIYALFGDEDLNLLIPPSYQVSRGENIGGVQSYLSEVIPNLRYDSWLTIGITDGDTNNRLSAIGIDFNDWDENTALNVDNGAIFVMDPEEDIVSNNEYVVGQFTVLTGSNPEIILNVQGKTLDFEPNSIGDKSWTEQNIRFNLISPRISDGTIPHNCESWYDGCNTCQVSSGILGGCTRMMCFRNDNPRCLRYIDNVGH